MLSPVNWELLKYAGSMSSHCMTLISSIIPENPVEDALSRRPEVEEETEKETPPKSDDDEWIAVSYQVEEQGGPISSMEFNQVISELVGGTKI